MSDLRYEREVGVGAGIVYVWFYSTHRENAKLTGLESWRCKVGHTKNDALKRILAQGLRTAWPEPPVIGLVIHTDTPELIERGIHYLLKLEGKWLREEGCGHEWFNTAPEEVEGVYQRVLNGEVEPKTLPKVKQYKEATLVVRIPTELLVEIDQIRSKRSRAQGKKVSRSFVVRLLLERALGRGRVAAPSKPVEATPGVEKDWDKVL